MAEEISKEEILMRCTKVTTKFSNSGRIKDLNIFIEEYKKVLITFVDLLWNEEKIPCLLPKIFTDKVADSSWLSARMIQCVGKQASGIVRGTKKKNEQRKFVIDQLNKEGKFKKARKLQKVYDEHISEKPEIDNVECELDSRFVKTDLANATVFDGWLILTSIGNKMKIEIPFKKSKHFLEMEARGRLTSGARLSKNNITFMFEIPKPKLVNTGKVLGIDIGQNNAISCSNGFASKVNKHGHDLNSINGIMCKKKKGSLAFKRCQEHRKNYINWTINQLNLDGIKVVNREDIKDLRRGKRFSRKLSHWTYTDIFDKLDRFCCEQGVLVNKINPTYTSQRCSECGWTCKSNRKGKIFKCGKCNKVADSDWNASHNISLELQEISKQQRLRKISKDGFYWLTKEQALIVPAVLKV